MCVDGCTSRIHVYAYVITIATVTLSISCALNVHVFAVDANVIESKESHGNSCRLETMGDILKTIFRDGGTSHAKYYRVSSTILHHIFCCLFVLSERKCLTGPLLYV